MDPIFDKHVRWVSAGLAVFKNQLPLQVLLVKYKLPNNRYVIEFPKGLVEPNDTDVLETALREVEEETCLSKDDIDIIHSIKPLIHRYMSWLHTFENKGLKKLYIYAAVCYKCEICNKTNEAEQVWFENVDKALDLLTKEFEREWLLRIKDKIETYVRHM